jgi:hypothetical protein
MLRAENTAIVKALSSLKVSPLLEELRRVLEKKGDFLRCPWEGRTPRQAKGHRAGSIG